MCTKKHCRIVTVNKIQFGFMHEKRTNDPVFIFGRLQEEYHTKGKGSIYVLWT